MEAACPCGGGQSCIVLRRSFGDWVHEDDVLKAVGLAPRLHCCEPFTEVQTAEMLRWFEVHDWPDSVLRETSASCEPCEVVT